MIKLFKLRILHGTIKHRFTQTYRETIKTIMIIQVMYFNSKPAVKPNKRNLRFHRCIFYGKGGVAHKHPIFLSIYKIQVRYDEFTR